MKKLIKDGKASKKATYQVTKQRGGFENINTASVVPSLCQAYEISRKNKSKNKDPLKLLIEKQHSDGKTGDGVIQKIQINTFSYGIILFNNRIISNIANFCCTDIQQYKSALCWDFTFNFGKSPPFFTLVLTYQNASLLNKRTKKCPTMLGPILLCHKKDESRVEFMCDTLLEKCPGLNMNMKVLGADGENSILQQTCHAFRPHFTRVH